jgi:hypothetical protein
MAVYRPSVKLNRRLKEKHFPDRYLGRHEIGDKNGPLQPIGCSAMVARETTRYQFTAL